MPALRFSFTYLILAFAFSASAQLQPQEERSIDSLKQIIGNTSSDTVRIKALFEWDNFIYFFDTDLDLTLNKKVSALCEKNLRQNLKDKELSFFSLAYARSMNNTGLVHYARGDYSQAVEFYSKSLSLQEKFGDKAGAANTLNNIGLICDIQNDSKKALEYHSKSLKLREEIGDKQGIANSLMNIGTVYSTTRDHENAVLYFTKALKIHEENKDKRGIAGSYLNIGNTFKEKNELKEAKKHFQKSLELYKELEDNEGIAFALGSIGDICMAEGDVANAIKNNEQAFEIAKTNGNAVGMRNTGYSLYQAYKKTGKNFPALSMYETYVALNDSLNSEESKKEIVRQEFKYEYEKKVAADSIRTTEEKRVIAVQLKQEQTQRYMLYGGLALLFVFGGFMFNRFRVTKRQKNIIEHQKQIVEEKQREILDSIHYAKRIQQSLLPTQKYIEKNLNRLKK